MTATCPAPTPTAPPSPEPSPSPSESPSPSPSSSITCTYVIFQPSQPNPESVAWMNGITELAKGSISLFAPVYIVLMAIAIFRRFIIARI